jgi:hypothetical protein
MKNSHKDIGLIDVLIIVIYLLNHVSLAIEQNKISKYDADFTESIFPPIQWAMPMITDKLNKNNGQLNVYSLLFSDFKFRICFCEHICGTSLADSTLYLPLLHVCLRNRELK